MAGAIAARLALAILLALCGGIWLVRLLVSPIVKTTEISSPPNATARAMRWLRAVVLGWCMVWALCWVVIALVRLRYPFELEWNCGAMRDHCERLLADKPLYVPPGPDWFPYEYPPLYFWVSAQLMRLLHDSSFAPMRLVSILSTLGCCVVLYAWLCYLTQPSPPGPHPHPEGTPLSHAVGEEIPHRTQGVPALSHAVGEGGHYKGGAVGTVWGGIAAGIFLASYRFTGAWYDIERLDMLFLFLSLLGGYWLDRSQYALTWNTPQPHPSVALPAPEKYPPSAFLPLSHSVGEGGYPLGAVRGSRWVFLILSVVAFWLAFLTKQQAILFLFGAGVALAWRRQWISLLMFGSLACALCFGSVALLDRASHGWFSYYCFHVPLANGIRLNLAAQYFLTDLPLYAPLIVIIGIFGILALRRLRPLRAATDDRATASSSSKRSSEAPFSQYAVLISWAMMGLAGSLLSRAHWGGDQNVLMAGFLGLTMAACGLAARAEHRMPRLGAPLYALVLAQLVTLVYRPDAQVPRAANRAAGERYLAAVQRLEREGEVLCLDHGSFTTPRHFQLMALMDVVGTEKRIPSGLLAALRAHRYVAILSDAKPEPGGNMDELYRDYMPVECLDLNDSWIATGFPTPGPGRSVWILRPRR